MKERLQLNAVPKTARLMALLIRKTTDLGAITIIRGEVNTSTIILNHKSSDFMNSPSIFARL